MSRRGGLSGRHVPFAVSLGILILPVPAQGQEIRTGVTPTISLQYDDNPLRANALRGGDAQGDLRTTPAIDVDLRRMIGRQALFLGGTAGYDFHSRYKSLNRERIVLDGGADLRLGGFCRADLRGTFDYQQTDLGDLPVQIGNTTKRRELSASASCPKPVGLWAKVSGSRTVVTNSSADRSVFDLHAYDFEPALVYTRPSIGNVELTGRYADIVHPNRTSNPQLRPDRTRIAQIGVRVERRIAPRWGGAVAVYYAHSRTQRDIVRAYSGPSWQAQLFYTPSPRLGITVTGERQLKGESTIGAAFFISTREALDVERRFGTRTLLSFGISRESRMFRGEALLPGIPLRGADTSTVASAGIRYALTRKIDVSASVAHRRRDARAEFYDYSSTVLGARAGLRF